jgi:hypothetical protein
MNSQIINNEPALIESYAAALVKSRRAMSMISSKSVGMFLQKVRNKTEIHSDQYNFITENEELGLVKQK